MRPIGPRILVRPIEAPRPSSSLIYIPETVDADPSPYALVLAVGPGWTTRYGTKIPIEVQPMDTVIVKKYSSTQVTIDGQPAAVVMADDVLAIVDL